MVERPRGFLEERPIFLLSIFEYKHVSMLVLAHQKMEFISD
jgi:hypothetical protein